MLNTSKSGDNYSTDSIYYRDGVTTSVAAWAMSLARRQMYNLFCNEFSISSATSVLDIGVSNAETAEANVLEKLYPYKHKLTCAGLGDGLEVKRQYPEVNYVRIAPGENLPFVDRQFDIAYSNAVLEHVGGPRERAEFFSEALRVAKALFFTVPNRWFPIEHHTGIWLLHYSPALFRRTLKRSKKSYWAEQKNLDFLCMSTLREEFKEQPRLQLRYSGLCIGPFSSNIAMVVK